MFGNNLTELLKTFSKSEMKEFRDFLNSPFFNTRKAVLKLFEILTKFYPDFDNVNLTKESVFAKLFPGKKFNDGNLRVITHYLTGLAEKYLAYSKFEKSYLELSFLLKSELFERNQPKMLNKTISEATEFFEKQKFDSEESFSYKYRLENERTYYEWSSHYSLPEKIISKLSWENVYAHFKNFYVLKSLIMYLNTINEQMKYNKSFKSESFRNFLDEIRIDEFKDIPVIQMYYSIIKMQTEPAEDLHFHKVRKIISDNRSSIHNFDLIGAFVNLETYCMKKITEGDMKFQRLE